MPKSLDLCWLYFKLFMELAEVVLERKLQATFLIVKISLSRSSVGSLVPPRLQNCPRLNPTKPERLTTYIALSDDQKQMVDKGQIKIGMNEDAVYISRGARPHRSCKSPKFESGHTLSGCNTARQWKKRDSGLIAEASAMEQHFSSATWIKLLSREYINAEIFFQNESNSLANAASTTVPADRAVSMGFLRRGRKPPELWRSCSNRSRDARQFGYLNHLLYLRKLWRVRAAIHACEAYKPTKKTQEATSPAHGYIKSPADGHDAKAILPEPRSVKSNFLSVFPRSSAAALRSHAA